MSNGADDLQIARLGLKAGDVLVVKYLGTLSPSMGAAIKEAVEPQIPEGVKVLAIDQHIELSVLTREEIEGRL